MPGPEDFYDALAPFYHLIYPDWEASIARQAAALDEVIRAETGGDAGRTVLDVACGIGTQALGLAALGYDVTASDLSAGAVARLRDEAARRGLAIDAKAADMREVWDAHGRAFDVVLCADNALPHLLTDGEILDALRGFHRCTAPGGICIISIRDYESIDLQTARMHPHGVREEGGARWVLFQVWEPPAAVRDQHVRGGGSPRIRHPYAGDARHLLRPPCRAAGGADAGSRLRRRSAAGRRLLPAARHRPALHRGFRLSGPSPGSFLACPLPQTARERG
jgi:SAM-dependent methyltransferase